MTAPPPLDPSAHALFLDFDGTLVGFADDPNGVAVVPALTRRLTVLQGGLSGAFAVVSGRRIADLDRFLAPLAFAAAGVHGLERRGVGVGDPVTVLAGPETLDDVRLALRNVATREPRLWVEDKGTALVLHYRTAPDLRDAAERAMRDATRGRDDLAVMNGDHIVEVHPAGMDKGIAVAAFMREPPFRGRVLVYVGDDVTDEFALRRVHEAGGVAIKVGTAPSAAAYRLADVAAVHRWLGIADGEMAR